jgi:DNA processing protein
LRCWSTLHRIHGLGAHAVAALLKELGGVEAIFAASRRQLEAVLSNAAAQVDAILAGPDASAAEQDIAWLEQPGHHVLTFTDPHYPRLLRESAQPPMLLFVVGDQRVLGRAQLAVVGSRNATAGGVANAEAFAGTLARAGLVITSGLALGIDGAGHRGALAAGGCSIAVLGTGVDRVYPARHHQLAHAIAANGAVVSEFPLGTPPKPENFPRRNRIISALSLGTLVVEAAVQSGSLITARYALEQGREVFAVPGSIHSPQARGCHALLRQGAKLVETAQDVLEELGSLAQWLQQTLDENRDIAPTIRDPRMAQLLHYIGYDPVSIDALVERSGLTAEYISSMLLEMELNGIVEACPGGTYMRV